MGTFIGLLVLIGVLIGDGERVEKVAARESAAKTTQQEAPDRLSCIDKDPHQRDLTIPYPKMPEAPDD